MTYYARLKALLFGLSMLGMGPQAFGQSGTKQPAQATSAERVNFAPGGLIRLNTSSGNLFVEAWDRPEVEIAAIKSTRRSYEPTRQDQAAQCLEGVRIGTERRSDTELEISTAHAGRKCGVLVELQIRVPRNSRLNIHHGAGYVMVSRVTGAIEASSRSGDIVLMLPDPGSYSIDAKSKFGSVYSDFSGAKHRRKLVGEQFTGANPPASHRIYLRMGLGGITILEVPSTPEAPVAAGVP